MTSAPSRARAGPPVTRQGSRLALLHKWIEQEPADDRGGEQSTSARLLLPLWYEGDETPGDYPFTRGRTTRMYHDELWVMGQYSGYATPSETRKRFDDLLRAGQTGLSVALDLPTQMGLDSDHPLARGEVGRVGVPLDTVEDLLTLFRGLPLARARQLRTTANAIGPIFTAFIVVALEELGVSPKQVRVMLQNDPLKEYPARGTFIFPPVAAVGLAVDVIEYFARELPHWEPIEFCGYHIRDAGATAVQEIAIATCNGLTYLDEARARGVDVTDLCSSLYLFLSAGVDIFEEAAKIRAARRLWARILHEFYEVPRAACGINVFAYTLGGALTAQEPINNVIRVTCETLAGVLGGVQTLATSSFDEALGLPSPSAARLALRTQQIVAYEAGVTKVVDPLAGSYYVEDLTNRLEAAAGRYLIRLLELGGAVATVDSGFVEEEIGAAAYEHQRAVESGEQPIVGVNVHRAETGEMHRAFTIGPELERHQIEGLSRVRQRRNRAAAEAALRDLAREAGKGSNTIPFLIDAARARATIGEIVSTLGGVLGHHPQWVATEMRAPGARETRSSGPRKQAARRPESKPA
jgi:methylmalonyl-CoA mutase, N-terminal domain